MRLTQPPLSYIPLLPILTGVVAGVLIICYAGVDIWIAFACGLGASAAAVILKWRVAAELLLAMTLAFVTTSMALPRTISSLPSEKDILSGRATEVELRPESQRIRADVNLPGGTFVADVTFATFTPAVSPGDIISFSGSWSFPKRDVDLPLEDDMAAYYRNHGVSLLCYVPKDKLTVAGHEGDLLTAMLKWRAYVVNEIAASGLDEPAAAFVAAILTGDDTLLPPGYRERYAAAGVAHILALSGAHVAIIVVVLSMLLAPLGWCGYRRARWWITIAILWLYAMFTGLSPSVCRAVIMATSVLLSLILDRPKSSLNALCLAAILILIFSPMSLFNAGFQLSFAATAAIIIFVPALAPVDLRKYKGGAVAGIAVATIAATLGTMPLVAYWYHSLPAYFLIANIAAVAVMPLMMSGGVLLMLSLAAGMHPSWLVSALDFVYNIFDGIVDFAAGLPGASVDNLYFDGWLMLPMYLALAFLALFLYRRHKSYIALCGATALFVAGVYLALKPHYADNEAYMVRGSSSTTIAVHHGDTLRMFTTAPPHNFEYERQKWRDRYRDYIATRGIKQFEVYPLGSAALHADGTVHFGHRRMIVAGHVYRQDSCSMSTDYCLVTAQWYGSPVELYHSVTADTVVLSSEINRRRRQRYFNELTAARIPVIDLSKTPLMSY